MAEPQSSLLLKRQLAGGESRAKLLKPVSSQSLIANVRLGKYRSEEKQCAPHFREEKEQSIKKERVNRVIF